jgi:hypothetical protein
MGVLLGHGAYIGMGEQTVYETAVAPTHFMRIVDSNLDKKLDIKKRPNLGTYGDPVAAPRSVFVAGVDVKGKITLELGFNDPTVLWLKHCIGANVDAGSGPYTHTMTPARACPAGTKGLTVHQVDGQNGPSNPGRTYSGVVVESWEMTLTPGDVAKLSIDVMARNASDRTAAVAATFATAPPLVLGDSLSAAGLVFNSAQIGPVIKSIKLKDSKGLVKRMGLDSIFTAEPTQGDDRDVQIEVTYELESHALESAHLATTVAALSFTVDDGSNGITFTADQAYVDGAPRSINKMGIIEVTATFKLLLNASGELYELVVTNDKATAETP